MQKRNLFMIDTDRKSRKCNSNVTGNSIVRRSTLTIFLVFFLMDKIHLGLSSSKANKEDKTVSRMGMVGRTELQDLNKICRL